MASKVKMGEIVMNVEAHIQVDPIHKEEANSDHVLGILAFVVIAVLPVPFLAMRAAMMELQCFVARSKEVDPEAKVKVKVTGPSEDEVDLGLFRDPLGALHRVTGAKGGQERTMRRAIKENAESKGLRARLYVTTCCSVLAAVFVMLMPVLAVSAYFYWLKPDLNKIELTLG